MLGQCHLANMLNSAYSAQGWASERKPPHRPPPSPSPIAVCLPRNPRWPDTRVLESYLFAASRLGQEAVMMAITRNRRSRPPVGTS